MTINYLPKIEKIKNTLQFLQGEDFSVVPGGTHHQVFVSANYVIRFRKDNANSLMREARLLTKLNHPLIPKLLWSGKVSSTFAMVEKRLPGDKLNLIWNNIPKKIQHDIIGQIIDFIYFLRKQKNKKVYSIGQDKYFDQSTNYLTDSIKSKIAIIRKNKYAVTILEDILESIDKNNPDKASTKQKEIITLVHGDLIAKNLLTDGKKLTGIIDWELSFFGDPDYDLCRLLYYAECAKAYEDQGMDEDFEVDLMTHLIKSIEKSKLIKNKKLFDQKYQFNKAIFYINALVWSVKSTNPRINVKELVNLWNKNRG